MWAKAKKASIIVFAFLFSVLLIRMLVFLWMFGVWHRGFEYEPSFVMDISSLGQAEYVEAKGFQETYSIEGRQYCFYKAIEETNANEGNQEDAITLGKPLYIAYNDTIRLIFFEIDGFSTDVWLVLCRDHGNGRYDFTGIFKESSTEEVPKKIKESKNILISR